VDFAADAAAHRRGRGQAEEGRRQVATAASPALAALKGRIAGYYSAKLRRHGATPRGVDWPSAKGQALRFEQLLRICDFGASFSLDDVGCGWGALPGYLRRRHPQADVDYLGIDLSAEMVEKATRRHRGVPSVAFVQGDASPRRADYAVASGIFNVRGEASTRLWQRFVAECLSRMSASSRRGFAVNFLAPLPKGDLAVPELYRPRPQSWARFCETELGCRVELADGYGLREFTLLARH
jgi:SAM-dependent methyltransferase